jgi:hypothetical protein
MLMIKPLVLAGLFLMATVTVDAAPIFTDTFTNGSTVGAASVPGGTASASFTSYDIASTKNATTSTITGGTLSVVIPATTSGFSEAQAVFTASPVSLAAVGDSITLRYVFTDSANVMNGTISNSTALWTGLYNSGSSLPLTTLANSALTSTATTGSILTTGVAPWQGFVMRIVQLTGTSSAVQELLGNNVGGGAYNGPTGVTLRTLSGSGAPALTVGDQYTVDYTITLLNTGTLGITGNLFSGAGTSGPLLFTATGTASGANALTTSFDGLAIGYRYNGASAASSLNVNSVEVTATLVPEPSAVGLAGLGLASLAVLWRRLRR